MQQLLHVTIILLLFPFLWLFFGDLEAQAILPTTNPIIQGSIVKYVNPEILTFLPEHFKCKTSFLLLPFQRQSDWSMGLAAAQVVWRSSTMANGEQFVIITGAWKRLHWCVVNSVVEILRNPEKLPILATTEDWQGTQVHALAMWALSPSAQFKYTKGDVMGFLFHVQVRHKSNKNSMWSLKTRLRFVLIFLVHKWKFLGSSKSNPLGGPT